MIGNCSRKIIRLLILIFSILKKKEIYPAYISKINSNSEKQTILLMIPNEEKEGWHYLAVKRTLYIIKRNNIKTSW